MAALYFDVRAARGGARRQSAYTRRLFHIASSITPAIFQLGRDMLTRCGGAFICRHDAFAAMPRYRLSLSADFLLYRLIAPGVCTVLPFSSTQFACVQRFHHVAHRTGASAHSRCRRARLIDDIYGDKKVEQQYFSARVPRINFRASTIIRPECWCYRRIFARHATFAY